jgi:hypothetical protein
MARMPQAPEKRRYQLRRPFLVFQKQRDVLKSPGIGIRESSSEKTKRLWGQHETDSASARFRPTLSAT